MMPRTLLCATLVSLFAAIPSPSAAFVPSVLSLSTANLVCGATTSCLAISSSENDGEADAPQESHAWGSCVSEAAGRRPFLASLAGAVSALSVSLPASAATRSTAEAVVTDKIFLQFKGLPAPEDATAGAPSRIVVGLFGQDAPQPVSLLKQLVSPGGLPAKCKPLDTSRLLQREQLEANKVYNSCKENEDSSGVNYDYSTVWRVDRDHRIDVGAVSGRFVSRENPSFEGANSGLMHDNPGVVSVRRGDDGGFGFTIFPGGKNPPRDLDEDNIIIGRVVEGMDVVQRLNELPVVQSSNVNYMGLTGGPTAKNAPSRACRYGGPMYCNELKPLKKIMVEKTGVLP